MPRIYLDHHSSTPVDPRVFEAMRPWFMEECGNPHASDHAFGWAAHRAVERAREQIAYLIGSEPDEVIFTSGATEANNLALFGVARGLRPYRNELLVSTIDHASVLEPARALQHEGFRVRLLPVKNDGGIHLDRVRAELSDRVALVSVIAVNNEIGTIQPLAELAALCHEAGALFHTDSAQALTATGLNVHAIEVDLMSLSGHKAYGPKGIGALYIRAGLPVRLSPLLFGGGQERGLRPGTLPTALCVGLGEACVVLGREGAVERGRLQRLSVQFLQLLRDKLPSVTVNGGTDNRHPGNLNLCFPSLDAASVVEALQPDLACSTGSACHSGAIEPSHVLTALGLPPHHARASIRFGIGRFTTESDIESAACLIVDAINRVHAVQAA